MGAIVKALQSIVIALGVIAIVGAGVVLYYNVVNPPGPESEAEALADTESQDEASIPEASGDISDTEGVLEASSLSEDGDTADSPGTDQDATPSNTTFETPLNLPNVPGAEYDEAGNIVKLNAPLVHKHQYDRVVSRMPSCISPGEARYTCNICGEFYTEAIPLTDHIPGEWITIKAATDGSPAIQQKYCTVCGRALSEQSGGGSSSNTQASGASSQTQGQSQGQGQSSSSKGDPDHQHSYTYKISTKPTCTKKGEREYECKECGDKFKVDIPKLNHPSVKHNRTEGTCGKPGKDEEVCDECGEIVKTTELTYPHSWGGWYTTVYPTAVSAGTAERVCGRCETKETKVVPKLVGIDAYKQHALDATPANNALIDPDDHPVHQYKLDPYKSVMPDCSTQGKSHYECECGAFYDEVTGPDISVHHLPPNITTINGKNYRICIKCGTPVPA